ncbi:MAG: hypothetical protein HONBIEJF_00684 [Fimbriimonadaceae bacterium]|nr:hypothetical protein [Fimbriimonadaceae bacterium]
MNERQVLERLDRFSIEVPSWGFADTGTRFGKFYQPAAAATIDEKLHDAGVVHRYTGCCPSVAVHVLWDFPPDRSADTIRKLAESYGVRIGSINPNLFQDQAYKFGSVCSPSPAARQAADDHVRHCIDLLGETGSKLLSLWFADGTNYPGQDDLIRRRMLMIEALQRWHELLPDGTTMLVEYKPFEPAFYHSDIADWGASLTLCQHAGPKAKVLVDTGHHLQGTNIEQIVGILLTEGRLGGFHFNDRRYADDDLTLGSIDPYAVFRIFSEIVGASDVHGLETSHIAYMVDQSHNLKPKIQAMIQTAVTAQELFAKACLVDRDALRAAQDAMDIVAAENILREAFFADVAEILGAWRSSRQLPTDPLRSYRESGLEERLGEARGSRLETLSTSAYA